MLPSLPLILQRLTTQKRHKRKPDDQRLLPITRTRNLQIRFIPHRKRCRPIKTNNNHPRHSRHRSHHDHNRYPTINRSPTKTRNRQPTSNNPRPRHLKIPSNISRQFINLPRQRLSPSRRDQPRTVNRSHRRHRILYFQTIIQSTTNINRNPSTTRTRNRTNSRKQHTRPNQRRNHPQPTTPRRTTRHTQVKRRRARSL